MPSKFCPFILVDCVSDIGIRALDLDSAADAAFGAVSTTGSLGNDTAARSLRWNTRPRVCRS